MEVNNAILEPHPKQCAKFPAEFPGCGGKKPGTKFSRMTTSRCNRPTPFTQGAGQQPPRAHSLNFIPCNGLVWHARPKGVCSVRSLPHGVGGYEGQKQLYLKGASNSWLSIQKFVSPWRNIFSFAVGGSTRSLPPPRSRG